jgi:hypothetical protein
MDYYAPDAPVCWCQNLRSRRGPLDQTPNVRRGSSAKHRLLTARFHGGQVVRITASGLVPDPINPSMNAQKGSAFLPGLNLIGCYARTEQIRPGHHTV